MKEEKKDKDHEGAICKVCSGDHTKNKDGQPEVLIHCAQCTSSGESIRISALDMKLQYKGRTKSSIMPVVYKLTFLISDNAAVIGRHKKVWRLPSCVRKGLFFKCYK